MNLKYVWCVAISFASTLAFAQGKFISDAGIAINAMDFEEAKTAIEKAQEVITQKQSAGETVEEKDLRKFWRYKEHIYLRLAKDQTDSLTKLSYLDLSKQAALKYLEVDKTKYYEQEVKDDMKVLAELYLAAGVEYFNKRDYNNALRMFEEGIELNKISGKERLAFYHNAAFSALNEKKYDKAISYFSVLIGNKYDEQKSMALYKRSMVRAFSELGNKDMALQKIQEFNKDSVDTELLKEEISILIDMKKQQEALTKMDQLVNMGFKDALTYENMGKLYEQIGEKEKALISYRKALEIDSSRADSYYGIGKISCLEFNDINKEINVLNKANEEMKTIHANKNQDKINANTKLIAEKEKMAAEKAKEGVEYLEKALVFAPTDKDILNLSFQIYVMLGEEKKAADTKEKLSRLK
ncbi:MAG: tetratricopeptide repeat protein [Flavobacteriales bacterium]